MYQYTRIKEQHDAACISGWESFKVECIPHERVSSTLNQTQPSKIIANHPGPS